MVVRNDIIKCFDELVATDFFKQDDTQKLVDYFESTWIEKAKNNKVSNGNEEYAPIYSRRFTNNKQFSRRVTFKWDA